MPPSRNQPALNKPEPRTIRISVVIPVYNGAAFIQRCLNSVFAQTHPATEIIVIDDGSTDGTPDILRHNQPAVRVITQTNAGRSAARNRAINEASGAYVAFLDADDEFLPDHLRHLAHAATVPDAEIIYDVIGPPFFLPHERLPRQPYAGNPLKHLACCRLWIQNAMVKREWVLRNGILFDPELSIAEDNAFFWKMILLGARINYVRQIGTTIGIHDANTTADPAMTALVSLRAYDAIEQFIRARNLPLAPNVRKQIAMGRRHKQIMNELLSLHATGATSTRRHITPLAAMLLSPKPTRPVERCRCLLALVAMAVPPLMRNHRFQRIVFGFSVSRSRCAHT
jgi:glycosyltransferase involved in cell wall biosynthesis